MSAPAARAMHLAFTPHMHTTLGLGPEEVPACKWATPPRRLASYAVTRTLAEVTCKRCLDTWQYDQRRKREGGA